MRAARPVGLAPWYEGVAPAEATVRCGGAEHRVRWQRGRVVLLDHDLGAEEALAALGGGVVTCLDVLHACRHHLRAFGPLALWVEGDAGIAADPGRAAAGTAHLVAERRLDALRGLPVAFRRRLALASLVAAGRRGRPVEPWEDPGLASVLGSLLVPAVRRSLVEGAGPPEAAAALDVRWTAIAADERPAASGQARARGGWARVRVPASWAARVWAQGLAGHDGALVLDTVRHAGGDRLLIARWRPDGLGRWQLETGTARRG